MPMATETAEGQTVNPLVLSREPKGPLRAGDKGSIGDTALTDAMLLILAGWALLFLLAFSLRSHNI